MKRIFHGKAQHGFVLLQFLGLALLTLMIAALCVDGAFYYTVHNRLQTAAESGALAAAQRLHESVAETSGQRRAEAVAEAQSAVHRYDSSRTPLDLDAQSDIRFGFIDPASPQFDPQTFSTSSRNPVYAMNGGYNAVAIMLHMDAHHASGAMPTLLANLFGVHSLENSAWAVAMLDGNLTKVNGQLRPFFACKAQYDAANAEGNPAAHNATILGSLLLDGKSVSGCSDVKPGAWGLADFRPDHASPLEASKVASWLSNGYNNSLGVLENAPGEGPVEADRSYPMHDGNPIKACRAEVQALIDAKTVFPVPLVDKVDASGAHVVGFSGFVLTGFQNPDAQGIPTISGYFTHAVCSRTCVGQGPSATAGNGLVKIRLAG